MTESADDAKPEIRGGVPLPKVTSAAASELFSPDPVESSEAEATAEDGDAHTATLVGPVANRTGADAPRHARRSAPKAGFVVAAAAALVAVPLIVVASQGGGGHHGPSAQKPPPDAAGVPVPGDPGAGGSRQATPTPSAPGGTHAPKPGTSSKPSRSGSSSGGGSTTGGGTTGGGGTSGTSGSSGGGTSGTATTAPAGPPVGGWAGRPGGRPAGGMRGGGPRGGGMRGGFR